MYVVRTYVRAQTYAYTHTQSHTHTHAHTDVHAHAPTHAPSHTHTSTLSTFQGIQDTRFRAVASAVFARAFGASWVCRIRRPASELRHVCPRTSLASTRRIAAPVSERLALTRSIPRRRQPWSNRNGEMHQANVEVLFGRRNRSGGEAGDTAGAVGGPAGIGPHLALARRA